MSFAPPTVSALPAGLHSELALGAYGEWTPSALNVNNVGPNFLGAMFGTNPVLAPGFDTFQAEIQATSDHDIDVTLVLMNPETGVQIGPTAVALLGNMASGVTELAVFTFSVATLGFVLPAFGVVFSVNNSVAGTFITATIRGSA